MEACQIKLFPKKRGWPETGRILIAAGFGMSVALASYSPSEGFQIRCSPAAVGFISDPRKHCTACGHNMPTSAFQRNKSKKDGLESHCKACVSGRKAKAYRKKIQTVVKSKGPRCGIIGFNCEVEGAFDEESLAAFTSIFSTNLKEMIDHDKHTKAITS